MEKRIDQIDETRKNFKAQYPDLLPDEETKKEEVNISEVEKALEEVRKELTLKEATEPRNLFKNNNLLDTFFRLHDVAQNLVKALEAEKSKQNEAKAECAKPVSVFRNSNSLSKEEYENCNVLCGKTILYKKGSLEFIKIEDLLDVIEQIQKDFEELKSK
jgi:D-hexose-6-phosphate mutarotase